MINKIYEFHGVRTYAVDNNILLRVRSEKYNLNLLKVDFEFKIQWVSEEEKVLGFHQLGNQIIYNSKKNCTTICRDKDHQLVYFHNEVLYDLFPNTKNIYENIYFGSSSNNNFIKFDLLSGQLIELIPETPASIFAVNNMLLIVDKKSSLLKLKDFNNNLLWQADVSQLGAYTTSNGEYQGEINNIYHTDNKVIVLTGLNVVAFNIKDGSILWNSKLDTWQSRGVIHKNNIYTTSGLYLNKINIDTGKIIYEHEFPFFDLDGHKKLSGISELVWHNNAIWTVMDTRPPALIAFDPDDGSYQQIISLADLGIKQDCHPPKFEGNRMYLLDLNHTLHIFEMG